MKSLNNSNIYNDVNLRTIKKQVLININKYEKNSNLNISNETNIFVIKY